MRRNPNPGRRSQPANLERSRPWMIPMSVDRRVWKIMKPLPFALIAHSRAS